MILPDVPLLVISPETDMLLRHCWHHVGQGRWQRDGDPPVSFRQAMAQEEREANARAARQARLEENAHAASIAESRRVLAEEESAHWRQEAGERFAARVARQGKKPVADVTGKAPSEAVREKP